MGQARPHLIPNGEPTLSIRQLTIEFGRRNRVVRVVRDVGLEVWPKEIVGIIGESGSGKTLTALSVLRLLPRRARITSGDIRLGSASLREQSERQMREIRGRRIALISQNPFQALNPTMRIGRQVGEPLELHCGLSWRQAAKAATILLSSVGLGEPTRSIAQYPHQFSGGMLQRATIAMGLALGPELLIADEPTSALDVTIQAQVLNLLREIRDSSGASILFITHDLGVVAQLCDWVYVMRAGEVVDSGSVEKILSSPEAEYTRMLLAASPSLTPLLERGASR
jgi:peptide/nickel transport system ATP-binding protein